MKLLLFDGAEPEATVLPSGSLTVNERLAIEQMPMQSDFADTARRMPWGSSCPGTCVPSDGGGVRERTWGVWLAGGGAAVSGVGMVGEGVAWAAAVREIRGAARWGGSCRDVWSPAAGSARCGPWVPVNGWIPGAAAVARGGVR